MKKPREPVIGPEGLKRSCGEEVNLYKPKDGHYPLAAGGTLKLNQAGFCVLDEHYDLFCVENGDKIGKHDRFKDKLSFYRVKGL